jgi:integrase
MSRRKYRGLSSKCGHWWIEFTIPRPGRKPERHRYSTGVKADCHGRGTDDPPARVLAMVPETVEEKRALVAERQPAQPYASDPSLAGFAEYYLNLDPSLADLRLRKILIAHLVRRFPGADLTELSWLDVEKWQREMMTAGLAPRTINQRVTYASSMFNRAIRESSIPGVRPVLTHNPCIGVKPLPVKRRDVILSREEEEELTGKAVSWLRALIPFAILTGLRVGEICRLRREWVTWDAKTARIVLPAGETKGTRLQARRGALLEDELVVLSPEPISILRAQPMSRHGFVFMGHENAPLRTGGVQKAFARARAKAGIPDVHFHDLRHTGATRLALAGATVWDLIRWGRWKDIRMAQRYVDVHGATDTNEDDCAQENILRLR